jgi:hypothetical protein
VRSFNERRFNKIGEKPNSRHEPSELRKSLLISGGLIEANYRQLQEDEKIVLPVTVDLERRVVSEFASSIKRA